MTYNTEYLNIKYSLIDAFLLDAPENILDVSYSVESKNILVQVVLLHGTILQQSIIDKVNANLIGYTVGIDTLSLTKDQFNENIGDCMPIYYAWLPYLLFSKAEVL